MSLTPTPHNGAKAGDFARTVLMPGDPLRAKYIAETYLTGAREVTSVRNMLGYTGSYKGIAVSVMGGGMGMPSVGIYSYELFNFYGVDNIIRVGSAGALSDDLALKDIVLAEGACTDSRYSAQYGLPGTFAPIASFELLRAADAIARELGIRTLTGNVLSSDSFYNANKDAAVLWRQMGVLCTEMEAAALYMNAAQAKKHALAILSISDHIFKGQELSAEDRQVSFTAMMELALELAYRLG